MLFKIHLEKHSLDIDLVINFKKHSLDIDLVININNQVNI